MVAGMLRIKTLTPLLAAVILAGCGTSSSVPPTSTGKKAPVTGDRATYIAKADALCKDANARQEALRRRAKGFTPIKLVPILRQQATIASTLSTDLSKLSAPASDHAAVARYIGAVRQLSVYSRAVANSIAARHARAVQALAAKLGALRQQETLLGQGYGYKICSSGKAY